MSRLQSLPASSLQLSHLAMQNVTRVQRTAISQGECCFFGGETKREAKRELKVISADLRWCETEQSAHVSPSPWGNTNLLNSEFSE